MAKRDYLRPALDALIDSGENVFGPNEFASYCDAHGLEPPRSTASVLSLDTLGQVPRYLRDEGAMVFRMGGSAPLTRTRFVLARAADGPEIFFLDDAGLFQSPSNHTAVDPLSEDRFLGYTLAPKLQEMALVNLGLGCGVLGRALGLEEPVVHAPAMLLSRYTFPVRLHPDVAPVFDRVSGQIQIDSLFTARRGGQLQLFVLEAKRVRQNASLAKHKLVYPALAMQALVGERMPVIPVYLSILEKPDAYEYRLAECQMGDTLADLSVVATHVVSVRKVLGSESS